MHRRLLFLTLAGAFIVSGLGTFEARAGSLPSTGYTLAQILSGSPFSPFTVDGTSNPGGEVLTFSDFNYTHPGVAHPTSGEIQVIPFTLAGPPAETGITFTGGFAASAMTTSDYSIFYTVTAPVGEKINDAFLSFTGGNSGGTGTISIVEHLSNPVTGASIGTLEAGIPGVNPDTISFAGVQSIRVEKDIFLNGGSLGANVTVIDQGFSSTTIPEPASMALLGIGLSGLFTLRRFFKRTSVA